MPTHYRRGVGIGEVRGLETVGHGGLWPGYRTEFLRVPAADLTVIVIANLASIDPWRLAHAIAADALEGDKRLKPKLAPITEAEIKPIAGTWFNADEPSLFDLAWKNGEAVGDPERHALRAGPPARRLVRRRARLVRVLASSPARARCASTSARAACCRSRSSASARPCRRRLAGTYVSADSGATWDITRNGEGWQGMRERPPDRGRPGLAGARRRCRHDRDRDAGPLDHDQPARPSGARPRRQGRRPSRSRPAASRRCGLSGRLSSSGPRALQRRDHEAAAKTRAVRAEISGTGSRTAGRRWSTARSGRARA